MTNPVYSGGNLYILSCFYTHTHTHLSIYGWCLYLRLRLCWLVMWSMCHLKAAWLWYSKYFGCSDPPTDLSPPQHGALCACDEAPLTSSFPIHGQLTYLSVSLLCKILWQIAFYLRSCAHMTVFSHVDPRNDWIVCRRGCLFNSLINLDKWFPKRMCHLYSHNSFWLSIFSTHHH